MLTMKELMTGPRSSPDGKHWEPSLPYPAPMIRNIRDAWEVLNGRAHAVRQTPQTPAQETPR